MNKNIQLLFLFVTLLSFTACGGSDITPPNPNPPAKGEITDMVGKSTGKVYIQLSPSIDKKVTEEASLIVLADEKSKYELNFVFSSPDLALGETKGINFKKLNDKFTFKLKAYKPIKSVLIGDEIPTYLKEWFYESNKITLTKVVLGQFVSEDGGVYDIENQTMSILYTTDMVLHYSESDKPLTGYKLEFNYPSLLKQK